jgi:uncharacterized protein (TIGR02145 family)
MKRVCNFQFSLFILACTISVLALGCKKAADEQETATDKDGNVYHTTTIGTQTWFVENLKTTKYNDGTSIPNVTGKSEWDNLATAAYCWYNNDAATYKGNYGALYNWFAVNTGKLCPIGWHVATDEEWTTLSDFLGGTGIAGGRLKEDGTTHWSSPNEGAGDDYGFKALPAGDRYPASGFEFWGINEYCAIWTSTMENANYGYYREMYNDSEQIYREGTNKKFGFSVRCIKD